MFSPPTETLVRDLVSGALTRVAAGIASGYGWPYSATTIAAWLRSYSPTTIAAWVRARLEVDYLRLFVGGGHGSTAPP